MVHSQGEGSGRFGVFAVQVLQWPRAVSPESITFAQCGHLLKSTVMAKVASGRGEFRLAEAGNDWHVLVRGSFLSGRDGTSYAEKEGRPRCLGGRCAGLQTTWWCEEPRSGEALVWHSVREADSQAAWKGAPS